MTIYIYIYIDIEGHTKIYLYKKVAGGGLGKILPGTKS
jgi:hypothetical protein